MSFDATLWGLKDAPAADTGERIILTIMGEAADEDGCCCYLAQATIAGRALMSDRTVRRKLADMEERGLIARGDQRAVDHYPADQRPVVWDLQIPYSWFSNIDRINETRATRGRKPLTPAMRPDLKAAPDPKKRADAGQPKPRKDGDSDTVDTAGLQVRSTEQDDGDKRTGLQVRPDSVSGGTGLQVQGDRTSSPTTQSFTQSLNPQNPLADAIANDSRVSVQGTIDGAGEVLGKKEPSIDDIAAEITRVWFDHWKTKRTPIAGQGAFNKMRVMVKAFLGADYSAEEIKGAFRRINAPTVPTSDKLQRELAAVRGVDVPAQGNGARGAGARVNGYWDDVRAEQAANGRNGINDSAPSAEVQTTGAKW